MRLKQGSHVVVVFQTMYVPRLILVLGQPANSATALGIEGLKLVTLPLLCLNLLLRNACHAAAGVCFVRGFTLTPKDVPCCSDHLGTWATFYLGNSGDG